MVEIFEKLLVGYILALPFIYWLIIRWEKRKKTLKKI